MQVHRFARWRDVKVVLEVGHDGFVQQLVPVEDGEQLIDPALHAILEFR
jgi:hypothetical protein